MAPSVRTVPSRCCRVYIWVSTWEMPSMADSSARNSASGGNSASFQAPNRSAGTLVITLKSRPPPQTTRCTCTPSIPFRVASYFSSTFCAATRLALSFSADHLHRHSRATRLKKTPFAFSEYSAEPGGMSPVRDISVKVWTSTWLMPRMEVTSLRKFSSGLKRTAAQASKFSAGILVMTFKSLQPPQTTRCTWEPGIPLNWGSSSSITFWASTKLRESLSSDHLHLHSRAMRLNWTPSHTVFIGPSSTGATSKSWKVYVCVSTWEIPSIPFSSSRKAASGPWPEASKAPKSAAGTLVTTLKSLQPPHTTRCTSAPAIPFSAGRCFSSTCWAAERAALSVHLHRHSRATRLKSTPGAFSIMGPSLVAVAVAIAMVRLP
mmetsp:Transcript_137267/g.238718  ORF Transcript_137267/g.238718 Transcript_137267/m.238718 type:complete len:377 (-) Transcript_137267:420-1550(-)